MKKPKVCTKLVKSVIIDSDLYTEINNNDDSLKNLLADKGYSLDDWILFKGNGYCPPFGAGAGHIYFSFEKFTCCQIFWIIQKKWKTLEIKKCQTKEETQKDNP